MECRSLCAGGPGVFPSSWILGVPLFAGGSVPLGFLLASRTLAGHALLSFSGCGSCRPAEFRFGLRSRWCVCFFLPLALLAPSVCLVLAGVLPLAACVPYVLGSWYIFFILRFWACLRSLVALSETWVPAGFSGIRDKTLLLLCWPPLFGACSRRCGSCRHPEFRFGLRSPWCVCFFLDLGCPVCTFGPVCLLGSCFFFSSWQCANWAWSTLLAASVPFVLGVLAYFRHRLF